MGRSSKPFCAPFPLIFFYLVTTSFLLDVEGAETSPSKRDIQQAQRIIGQFLRNETGSAWLSGLAKTNSTPLTTPDLMSAILRNTKEGDPVWESATILLHALNSPHSVSSRIDLTSEQSDNWKDMISKIEMEDDIICLYRKNGNETTKRADDWKKFLKTISPGYTVHLAIDTGLKYIICLKKIEVPKTTSEASSTTAEKPVHNKSRTVPSAATSQLSTVGSQPTSVPSASRAMTKISVETSTEKPNSDNNRRKKGSLKKLSDDTADIVTGSEAKANDSIPNKAVKKFEIKENRRRMRNSMSPGTPVRDDCNCRDSRTCEDERNKRFNDPTVFVILNPNDFSPYQSSSPPINPTICQSSRCVFKPVALPQNDIYSSLYDPRRLADSKRLRRPIYEYSNLWPSTVKHRSYNPKYSYLRKNVLNKKLENDAIARRTAQRLAKPKNLDDAITKVASCRIRPTFQVVKKRRMMRNSVQPYYIRNSNLPGLIRDRNRYKILQTIVNNEIRRSPQIRQIQRSSGPRQLIVQRPQSLVRNDSPYRTVYSSVSSPLITNRRPLGQNFDVTEPNFQSFAFLGSRLKPLCRNGPCMQVYQKPLVYVPPGRFPTEISVSKYPFDRFPLVYSENLYPTGNSILMHVPKATECPRPCDKPIKLQVLINGKVQEPLSVAVLSDIGQKLHVLGSDRSIHRPEPQNLVNYLPNPTRIPDDTNTYYETEINTRMDLQSPEPKETSLTESGLVESNDNSTTQSNLESTTLRSDIPYVTGINVEENSSQRTTEQTSVEVLTNATMPTSTIGTPTTV